MNAIFVDTSFYVALAGPHDVWHTAAITFTRTFSGRLLTTEYVLLETGNMLARSADRAVFVQLMEQLSRDRSTRIIEARHRLFQRGLELYSQRLDKEWSLTDCISFVTMRHYKIRDALTADRHFEQAGFAMLLK